MESFIYTVSKIFNGGGDVHYILPHFQREYVWGKEQWGELLRDLFFVYEEYQSDTPIVHFLGLMVMTSEGFTNGTIPQFKVIDGQQRLITLSLIFIILRDIAGKKKQTGDLAEKIDKMVTNYLVKENARYKVLPSTRHGDCATYMSILAGKAKDVKGSRITNAYIYLHRELHRRITSKDVAVELLYEVLVNSFQVAFVILDKENPYKIFESLDGKGKLLSQADLVRNYIAMTLPVDVQEQVFEESWIKMETIFQEQRKIGRSGELTAFIRHYLAMRRRTIYMEEQVYARFRDYIELEHTTTPAFVQEIRILCRSAEDYAKLLMPDLEPDLQVRRALHRLAKMEASVTYPLLLSAYEARQRGSITAKEFAQLISMLENLLIRRYLCAEGSSILFKWFATVWNEIVHMQASYSFVDACRSVIAGTLYPTDRHLKQSIHVVKPYSGRAAQHRMKIAFILTAIEDHLWGKTDVLPQLKGPSTIEHIMPQTLTEEWKSELGGQWEQISYRLFAYVGKSHVANSGKKLSTFKYLLSSEKAHVTHTRVTA